MNIGLWISRFMIYCFPPLFLVGLVYTLGLRDFTLIVDMRSFMKNALRRLL